MRIPLESRLLLACASRLVPRALRADWRREWDAEVWWWMNGRLDAQSIGMRVRLAAHCLGAFSDARCLRSEADVPPVPALAWFRTPGACLVVLVLLLALVMATSGGLRQARRSLHGAPFPAAGRLAILSQTGPFMGQRLGVPSARVDFWNAQSRSLDGAAVYVPSKSVVATGSSIMRGVLTAKAGADFFSILGIRAAFGRVFTRDDTARCRDCALVSYDFWRRKLNADPAALGGAIFVDGRSLRIIGVLPRDFQFLGSEPAVWSASQPDSALATAVCRLKPGVTPQAAQAELRELIARAGRGTSGAWVTVTPLEAATARPIAALVPAWLLLAAVSALLAFAGPRRGFRRRAFWSAKAVLALTVLLLAGIEFGGRLFDVAPGDGLLAAGALSLWLFVAAPGFALWWSWADQRLRCRVCLARLAMPARMGYGARMLFETSGTELLCPKGHGALFVAGGADPHAEWAPLDATWRDLFQDGQAGNLPHAS
jgi:hypothetical protein